MNKKKEDASNLAVLLLHVYYADSFYYIAIFSRIIAMTLFSRTMEGNICQKTDKYMQEEPVNIYKEIKLEQILCLFNLEREN